jgi:predicted enzyme related to lactoylglutathione lyase
LRADGGTTPDDGGNDEFPALPRSVVATQQRLLEDEMGLDLFAGIPVTDYSAALPWYEQFFGAHPSFLPAGTEAVWEVAEHRYIYIVQEPERAGNALVLSFVDDLDERVAKIAQRGIEPARRETPSSGVTKVIYTDADGNEISFGGALALRQPSADPG